LVSDGGVGLGRKTTSPDVRGPPVSDARGEKENAALAWFAGPAAGFGPKRNVTRARGNNRPLGSEGKQAAGEGWAENEKMKIFVFFFLFNYFKVFSNDFET
jgi:hypothetical protein